MASDRYSFTYYIFSIGATVEEISHALNHSNIEQTQNYLKQFPSKYSDNTLKGSGRGLRFKKYSIAQKIKRRINYI
jgi:hypothetical protein